MLFATFAVFTSCLHNLADSEESVAGVEIVQRENLLLFNITFGLQAHSVVMTVTDTA